MNKEKIYRYGQLKILENKLKSLYNNNLSFKRIYRSNKNDNKENMIIITDDNNKNIFSCISKDVIDYLKKSGEYDTEIFDFKNKEISIRNYWDILDTIRILLSIIEYDLIKNYIVGEKYIIETE